MWIVSIAVLFFVLLVWQVYVNGVLRRDIERKNEEIKEMDRYVVTYIQRKNKMGEFNGNE